LTWFFTALWSLILGGIGWTVLEFIARPIRNFFDLRIEARKLLLLHHSDSVENAEKDYREISARFFAFDQAEPFAALFVRFLGFNPQEAANAFMLLTTKFGEPHDSRLRDQAHNTLTVALKFKL
jgi:hypothetical protein